MRRLIAFACLLTVELGCSQAKSLTDPSNTGLNQATANTVVVTITPTSVTAPAGDSVLVSAGVTTNGSAVSNASITWSAADTTIAKVSANGTVHLRKAGSTKLYAISSNDTASAPVTVQASNTVASVQLSPPRASRSAARPAP